MRELVDHTTVLYDAKISNNCVLRVVMPNERKSVSAETKLVSVRVVLL